MFVKLKTGDIKHVLSQKEDGTLLVQDAQGVKANITIGEVEKEVTKWYQIIKLLFQFAGVIIAAFKKG